MSKLLISFAAVLIFLTGCIQSQPADLSASLDRVADELDQASQRIDKIDQRVEALDTNATDFFCYDEIVCLSKDYACPVGWGSYSDNTVECACGCATLGYLQNEQGSIDLVSAPVVHKEEIFNLLNDVADWQVNEDAGQPNTWYCQHSDLDQGVLPQVYTMSFESNGMDNTPSMILILDQVKEIIDQNGFRKCSYFLDTDGRMVAETYIRDGLRLKLSPYLSTAVGDRLTISFEYGSARPEIKLDQAWYPFSNPTYTFKIPVSWAGETVEGHYLFKDQRTGERIASLTCPIPEVGYEAWQFEDFQRSIKAKDKTYSLTLKIGEPIDDSNEPTQIIFVSPTNADFLGLDRCQLWMDSTEEIARDIYQTVSIN